MQSGNFLPITSCHNQLNSPFTRGAHKCKNSILINMSENWTNTLLISLLARYISRRHHSN